MVLVLVLVPVLLLSVLLLVPVLLLPVLLLVPILQGLLHLTDTAPLLSWKAGGRVLQSMAVPTPGYCCSI
jgi:hypothetical protein